MADDGILLLKYWLEVSAGEQTWRLESRSSATRDSPSTGEACARLVRKHEAR
jgi:hypothetical protein